MVPPADSEPTKGTLPVDMKTADSDEKPIAVEHCKRCGRPYKPRKRNQAYCGNRCRAKVLALRKLLSRYLGCLDSQPGISARHLRDQLNNARVAAGLPGLQTDPDLQAEADLLEAEEQAARWAALVSERRATLRKLRRPRRYQTRAVSLRPGHGPLEIDSGWTHAAVAASDPQLAILVLARQTSPK